MAGKPRRAGRAVPGRHESGVPAIRLFTRKEIAAAFETSPLRITKWTAAGMPVAERGGRGRESRYSVPAVIAWRVESELQRLARTAPAAGDGGAAPASAINLGIERAKLARVQTRKAELEVRKREGELLEAADVARMIALVVLAIRSKLLALPQVMAERLVAAAAGAHPAAAIETELAGEVRDVLRELASWKLAEEGPAPLPGADAIPAEAVAS